MDKKRYMEILTEEMNKSKGACASVVQDVEYNTALRFAIEYNKNKDLICEKCNHEPMQIETGSIVCRKIGCGKVLYK